MPILPPSPARAFGLFLSSALLLHLTSACGTGKEAESPEDGAGGGSDVSSGGTANPGGGNGTGGETNPGGGNGSGGGSNDPLPTIKSAGCTLPPPTAGDRTMEVQGEMGDYILSLPASYSNETAYPLGFAFHGYGRTHAQCQNGDCAGFQSVMGEEAVLVYMKSFTDGWEQAPVRDQNAEFFEKVLAEVLAMTCIDEARVFVAGTSSGASFSNVLACRYGDRLLATAPVAGSLPESEDCVGKLAAVPIHGIDDHHVTFDAGKVARDFYVERNGCTTETIPDLATVHAEIQASRDIEQTNYKCVDYQGCDAGLPVRWCEHSEGGYDNSTHGWPTAGGQMIWDFIQQF